MQVVALKMASGEEVVGRLVSQDETTITLSTARVLMPSQGKEPGSIRINLIPWLYSVGADSNTPPINKDTVVLINEDMPQGLADMYTSETSPIQLVK